MSQTVPSFFVYGVPDQPLDVGFLHVETVMERQNLHFGKVSAHKHERMAQITFWTEGGGEYFIEDIRLEFIAPAVSFIPSGVVHSFTIEPLTTDAIVVSIADSALPPIRALSALDFERAVMVRGQEGHAGWYNLQAILKRLLQDYRSGQSMALASLVAVVANDIAALAACDKGAGHESDDLARSFKRLVDQHFRENWTVERYIEMLATTPHLLNKACLASTGLAVKTFINERRLIEAKRLLLFTVRSVEDIGFEIGFHDPGYFSRFFKNRTGEAPGAWRKSHG